MVTLVGGVSATGRSVFDGTLAVTVAGKRTQLASIVTTERKTLVRYGKECCIEYFIQYYPGIDESFLWDCECVTQFSAVTCRLVASLVSTIGGWATAGDPIALFWGCDGSRDRLAV